MNLLAAKEEYDVHAIAGLLKLWLRELPTTVLTREHRADFLHVIGMCLARNTFTSFYSCFMYRSIGSKGSCQRAWSISIIDSIGQLHSLARIDSSPIASGAAF